MQAGYLKKEAPHNHANLVERFIFNKHTPDVRRSPYATQWLHSWMLVLCVLGVCDEHRRPLFKLQVRETQQVMIKGQNSIPAEQGERTVLNSFVHLHLGL